MGFGVDSVVIEVVIEFVSFVLLSSKATEAPLRILRDGASVWVKLVFGNVFVYELCVSWQEPLQIENLGIQKYLHIPDNVYVFRNYATSTFSFIKE